MIVNTTAKIIQKADAAVKKAGSHDPYDIANALGINVNERPFKKQKGLYTVIERNRFIFIKEDLHPIMKKIVLLHEIGHDQLHRKEALAFHEFNLFDMEGCHMEYEANLFAAQIALPDEETIRLIERGYNVAQVAAAMHSDINLVALKVGELARRGYTFSVPEYKIDFLK